MSKLFTYSNPVALEYLAGGSFDLSNCFSRDGTVCAILSPSVESYHAALIESLGGNVVIRHGVGSNPDIQDVEQIDVPSDCSEILAVGGGSTLDAARGCFAKCLTGFKYSLSDLVETPELFVEGAKVRSEYSLTMIPTTFGTSSELTSWATLWDRSGKRKHSISHPSLYADRAFIRPELSVSLPLDSTLSTGLDVFSHALESFWNKRASFITRTLSLQAIELCVTHLPKLSKDLKSLHHRSGMARASMMAGLAFSQTRTASAHAMSYPLTMFHGIPHGFACSLTLGALFEGNESELPELSKVYEILDRSYGSKCQSFESCFKSFLEDCGAPTALGHFGVRDQDVQNLVKHAFHPERMHNMLRELSREDVEAIYRRVL